MASGTYLLISWLSNVELLKREEKVGAWIIGLALVVLLLA